MDWSCDWRARRARLEAMVRGVVAAERMRPIKVLALARRRLLVLCLLENECGGESEDHGRFSAREARSGRNLAGPCSSRRRQVITPHFAFQHIPILTRNFPPRHIPSPEPQTIELQMRLAMPRNESGWPTAADVG